MNRRILAAALLLVAFTAVNVVAQEGATSGFAKVSKGWHAAIVAEGTYDDPTQISQRAIDTLLALQKNGISPEYLKRIDKSEATLKNVVFWAIQGTDATTITNKVLATPGAQKYPPKSAKAPKKKK